MIEPPLVAEAPARHTAVIRLEVPRERMRSVVKPAVEELFGALAAQGIAPAGPWFTHHFRMDPAQFDFEIGVPVETPVRAVGRVTASRLPAARVARTIYAGPYDGLPMAWAELTEWITAHGHRPSVGLWESYVVGPETDPDPAAWRTELVRPLAR